ncbi:DUF4387 domain-containing protein [Roseobacter sp. YSTF-M11]|uniref:DUF4387 domain-containing protein n=1 Tax=Roseobacter insulae TaxID=2859783 RepID=A0A9X1FTI5_9RHOB|nr:DUF4387 family protein [Roseobacter insulae]MBW4707261.1 DUF4387 domain-containing protein [Roseobacter insulae]
MPELRDIVTKVRSKNAGPFWLTIDIFCGSTDAYRRVSQGLSTSRVAAVFQTDGQAIKRFDIPDLNVVKFSLPRPAVQGSVGDRDMHGASWAALIGDIEV